MIRLLTLVAIVGLGSTIAAFQAPAPAPNPTAAQLDVVTLRDNLFVITTSVLGPSFSGGNVAVLVTDAGVTLVDSKLPAWGPALIEKVKSITPKPVTRIISTHAHGDHSGNNDKFGTIEIVAHENAKASLAAMKEFQGANAAFLPTRTYAKQLTIGEGRSRIDLLHFGAGHTNGDTVIVFPALRAAHMGDMLPWKDGPVCDRNNGGSCLAYPKTIAAAAAALEGIETVIPGHAPMMRVSEVEEYARFVADVVSFGQASLKAGKTVDEAVAAFNLGKYPGYADRWLKPAIETVYAESK